MINLDDLNNSETEEINLIANELIQEIVDLKNHLQSLWDIDYVIYGDFWCSSNSLVFDISKLIYAKKLIEKGINVVVNDEFLLDTCILNKINVNSGTISTLNNFKKFKNYFSAIIKTFFSIAFKKKVKHSLNGKIILDSFLLNSSIKNKSYNDRWYSKEDIPGDKIYVCVDLRSFTKQLKDLTSFNSINKVYRIDDFLTLLDNFRALWKYLFFSKPTNNPINFRSFNITPLINKWVFHSHFNISIFHSIRIYKAYSNILKKYQIKRIVDWNEAQNIDRSLSKATYDNNYFDKLFGYRLFFDNQHQYQLYSTFNEFNIFLIPRNIVDCSLYMRNFFKYLPKENLETINLTLSKYKRGSKFMSVKTISDEIIVVLPIHFFESIKIINICNEISNKYHFLYRCHPNNMNKIYEMYPKLSFLNDDEKDHKIAGSKFLLTSTSSFVVEAVASKRYVGIFLDKNKLSRVPLYDVVKESLVYFSDSSTLDEILSCTETFNNGFEKELF